MNLDDLRAFTGKYEDHPLGHGEPIYDPVTVSDLKEALANLTPEQMEEMDADMHEGPDHAYLVVRL